MLSACAFVDVIAPPNPALARVPESRGQGKGEQQCALPAPGRDFTATSPEAVGVDPAAVQAAIAQLAPQFTASLRIYRHNCLIGQTANDAVAATEPAQLFSMTKTVVSLGVGRAVTLGKLGLDDPIGDYLPGLPADHARITVRNLLTQTSGLQFAWVNDLVGSAGDSVAEAMAYPVVHPPGTHFEYAQTTVTTLALVVQQAVGEDFQRFMQAELFGPVGIEPGTWTWWRDGARHTHGYSWLSMRPIDMAKLGTLVLDHGRWGSRQLIDRAYVGAMDTGTPTNPGYGFLMHTNDGPWYIDTFATMRRDHHEVMTAPVDLVEFAGFLEQATFVIPSLDLVVVRFGLPPGENWKWHLFDNLLKGIDGDHAAQPGPPPEHDDVQLDWNVIFSWQEILGRVASRWESPTDIGPS